MMGEATERLKQKRTFLRPPGTKTKDLRKELDLGVIALPPSKFIEERKARREARKAGRHWRDVPFTRKTKKGIAWVIPGLSPENGHQKRQGNP